jgi:hypothetical protein
VPVRPGQVASGDEWRHTAENIRAVMSMGSYKRDRIRRGGVYPLPALLRL